MSKATKKPILMNSVVCSTTAKQQNILSMFTSAAAASATTAKTEPKKAATVPVETKAIAEATGALTSDDPIVAAFYKTLTPAEMTAHRIATTKLGTSYDVTRTRGFLAWSKTR